MNENFFFIKIPVSILLNVLFLFSGFYLLLFFIADFFTVYYHLETQKFIFLDDRRVFLERNVLSFFGLSIGLVMVLIIFQFFHIHAFYKQHKFLVLFIILFIFYYIFIEAKLRGMFFFGILCTLSFYGFFSSLIEREDLEGKFIFTKKIIIYSCLVYLLLPLLIFLAHYVVTFEKYFQIPFMPQFYIVDSFRGITLDRIQYSFLAGITVFFVFFEKNRVQCYRLIIFLLLLGMYLALSRAALLALVVAGAFYFLNAKNISLKALYIPISFFILIILFLLNLSERAEIFSDGGNRLDLLSNSFETIFARGLTNFLFGYGNFYIVDINEYHQPHNSILQSIMNFGIVITTFWLLLTYSFFTTLMLKGKAILIYIFIFGLFHNGFSAFLFMPITVFSYISILIFNINDERSTNGNFVSQRVLEGHYRTK